MGLVANDASERDDAKVPCDTVLPLIDSCACRKPRDRARGCRLLAAVLSEASAATSEATSWLWLLVAVPGEGVKHEGEVALPAPVVSPAKWPWCLRPSTSMATDEGKSPCP